MDSEGAKKLSVRKAIMIMTSKLTAYTLGAIWTQCRSALHFLEDMKVAWQFSKSFVTLSDSLQHNHVHYPLSQAHSIYSAVAFYVRTCFWRSHIIQGKFSHRNKFALFQTLCINWDFINIFYITLFQICIKCDGTLYEISRLASSLQTIMVVIILTDIFRPLDHQCGFGG
jgi:hypothetical protein